MMFSSGDMRLVSSPGVETEEAELIDPAAE